MSFNLEELVKDSLEEDHQFLRRLINDYDSGLNRFNKLGESLYLAIIDNEIAGIGGLNQDPYINDNRFGRVRHLYVLRKFRMQGVGKALLKKIINEASKYYLVLGLRTNNETADLMYCSNGFTKGHFFDHVTHYMIFNKTSEFNKILEEQLNL